MVRWWSPTQKFVDSYSLKIRGQVISVDLRPIIVQPSRYKMPNYNLLVRLTAILNFENENAKGCQKRS